LLQIGTDFSIEGNANQPNSTCLFHFKSEELPVNLSGLVSDHRYVVLFCNGMLIVTDSQFSHI